MKYIRIYLFTLSFYFLSIASLLSQTVTDTLWTTWQDHSLPDTIRLAAIQRVAWRVIRQNPDSSENLARLQLELSEKIGHRMWQSKALNIIGVCHYLRDEYLLALKYYLNSLELKNEIGDLPGEASLHENISMVYDHLGRHVERLEHLQRAIQTYEHLKDSNSLSEAINKLANIYFDQSDYTKALEYYFLSLDLGANSNDSSSLAMTLSNIGAAYNGQENFREALNHYNKSLIIRRALSDEPGIAILYNNIADAYLGLNELDSANFYISSAIEIMTLKDNKYGLANAYFQLGQIAIKSDAFGQAINWCLQSLNISKAIGALAIERNACQCLYLINPTDQKRTSHKHLGIMNNSSPCRIVFNKEKLI